MTGDTARPWRKNLANLLVVVLPAIAIALAAIGFSTELLAQAAGQLAGKTPVIALNLDEINDPDAFVPALKIVAILTVLTVAPAILLMMTSFTRILIVLSFLRQALGTQTMPPNQVIIGLSMFLTLFTMSPVLDTVFQEGIVPYLNKTQTQEESVDKMLKPVRAFMLSQTRQSDLSLLMGLTKLNKPKTKDDIPFKVIVPAFMISELKTAFQIGFLVYIPFLVIDMVVSSVLMAMGMMMLPPTVVSLPFKLILFVLIDGWALIVDSLIKSFHTV